MSFELWQVSQDMLFTISAAAIAILTIMISLVCYRAMKFFDTATHVAENLEETTESINQMIKPASIMMRAGKKLLSLWGLVSNTKKKKKKQQNEEDNE